MDTRRDPPNLEWIYVQWFGRYTPHTLTLSLREISIAGWLSVAVALGILSFSIAVAVRVARTSLPRKWWWAIFALVGAGSFGIPLAGGPTISQPLSVGLPVVSLFYKGLLEGWVVSFYFPVGAVLALARLHKAREIQSVLDVLLTNRELRGKAHP